MQQNIKLNIERDLVSIERKGQLACVVLSLGNEVVHAYENDEGHNDDGNATVVADDADADESDHQTSQC